MKIDREDFESWRANPITEAFMKCCGVWAEEAKQLWIGASWDGGVCKETDLWRLKGQAEVLKEIPGITAERIEETLT